MASSSSSSSSDDATGTAASSTSVSPPIQTLNHWKDNIYVYCQSGVVDNHDKEKMSRVLVGEDVTAIEDNNFAGCTELVSVKFSSSNSSNKRRKRAGRIGCNSFRRCVKLLSIDMTATCVEIIGHRAFEGCEMLSSVLFSDQLKEIRDVAFCGCTSLATINLPRSTTLIGNHSFRDCTELTSLDLQPTAVRKIGYSAFTACAYLTTIAFPDRIEEIGNNSFGDCPNLTNVDFSSTVSLQKIGGHAFKRCENLTVIDLRATSVRKIEICTFYGCEKLETILLCEQTEEISNSAFSYCTRLKTIDLPESLRKIGGCSFFGCLGLTEVNIRSTVLHTIGESAFHGCKELTKISFASQEHDDDGYATEFPSSLVTVGKSVINGCPKLTKGVFRDTNSVHYECDLNRGGKQFLQRNENTDTDTDISGRSRKKEYFSSLWPLILYRIIYQMKLPMGKIRVGDDISLYTDVDCIRHASVIYYFMVHGIAMEY